VAGFATAQFSDGLAELEDLFVDPPRMRLGIGTALMMDISTRLNEPRFETLEVTANPHAIAFYRQLGFVEVRIVDTQGYPAHRMSRPTRPQD
jgi:ribosomal protein S18 acetylase RimI-like enzyme